jgi:Flp pilus assembly protein TadB
MMVFAIMILTLLSVWALLSAIFMLIFSREKPIEKLKYYDENYTFIENFENQKKSKINLLKLTSSLIPNLKLKNKKTIRLENELMKADIPIKVEELLVIKIFSSFVLAFLTYTLAKDYIAALILFVITWNVPQIIIASRKKKRIKLFDNQISEGITIISNSLKAGHSFLQAIAVVTEEMKDPFSKEFKKMLKEMSLGVPEESAFANLLTRMESEDLRLIINATLRCIPIFISLRHLANSSQISPLKLLITLAMAPSKDAPASTLTVIKSRVYGKSFKIDFFLISNLLERLKLKSMLTNAIIIIAIINAFIMFGSITYANRPTEIRVGYAGKLTYSSR